MRPRPSTPIATRPSENGSGYFDIGSKGRDEIGEAGIDGPKRSRLDQRDGIGQRRQRRRKVQRRCGAFWWNMMSDRPTKFFQAAEFAWSAKRFSEKDAEEQTLRELCRAMFLKFSPFGHGLAEPADRAAAE